VLDIGRMHVLSAVADHGSMAGAAAYLSYTPSAVSQKIAALERDVGIGLVERGAHGTSLTDAGRTLVRHAHEIIARLSAAEQELAELVGLRTGTLRIGAFPTAAAVLAPRALTAFQREHPGVEVSVWELEPKDAVAKLHSGEIDLALVYEVHAAPHLAFEGLECHHLFDDPLYVALPPGHRLADQDRVKLSDLADEPWIVSVQRGSSQQVLPASDYQATLALGTDSGQMAVQGCVAAGCGLALIPRLALPIVRRDVALCALDDDLLSRRVGMAVAAAPYRPAAITAMMHVLELTCRRLADPVVGLEDAEALVQGREQPAPPRGPRRIEARAGLSEGLATAAT
jgi:DNA-binding transcriptional LysR family regulator